MAGPDTRLGLGRVGPGRGQRAWRGFGSARSAGPSSREAVPAKVQARPCRIEIAYRVERSDPAYKHYLGTYFPCTVNRFGAFRCPEHAYGVPDDPPRTGFNARFFPRTGRIRLHHPPVIPVATPKPDWVRLYPVQAGFIVPFDRQGRLRPGLTLRGRASSRTTCTTFAGIHQRSRLYGCFRSTKPAKTIGGTCQCANHVLVTAESLSLRH